MSDPGAAARELSERMRQGGQKPPADTPKDPAFAKAVDRLRNAPDPRPPMPAHNGGAFGQPPTAPDKVDDPRPDLVQPAQGPREVPSSVSTGTAEWNDDATGTDWRIARSVAIKECNAAATGGFLPALSLTWTGKPDTTIQALASVMARWIVEGV